MTKVYINEGDKLMINVAAYCRVSTDKEDQKNSLEAQQKYFFDFISKNKDWNLVNIYADEGITGTNTRKRKQFNKMIQDAQNGLIDLIITKEVSRFARNTVDTLNYVRELKKIGVYIYFINDGINTQDEDGEFRLTIMASVAQEESRKISERVKWGQRRRMEQGIVFGNREMLGFYIENGQIYVNPKEAEIVRKIFHKFVIEGKGTHVIARELKEEGIKTKKGGTEWSSVMILRVLRNEKYVGDLRQGKYITQDYLTHKKIQNNDIQNTIYIKNHHEAIIDRNIWEKAQRELLRRKPSKDTIERYSNRYWCSGLIKCGYCGSTFTKKHYNTTTNKRSAWTCRRSAKYGKVKVINGEQVGCDNNSFKDVTLETCCNHVLLQILKNKEILLNLVIEDIKKVQTYAFRESYTELDIPMLQKSIEALEAKKEKAIDKLLSDALNEQEFKKMKERYNKEILDLQTKILEIEQNSKVKNEKLTDINNILSNVENIINNINTKPDILRDIIENITAFRNKMIIKIKNLPFNFYITYRTRGIGDNYEVLIEDYHFSSIE